MRRSAMFFCLSATTLVAIAALAGCGGGGSTDPGAAVEAASKHRDQAEGEYMLAEVELDKAYLAQDESEAVNKPRQAASAISRVLRESHKIEHECWEGDGLESCTEIEAIEEVVKEIDADAQIGPGR